MVALLPVAALSGPGEGRTPIDRLAAAARAAVAALLLALFCRGFVFELRVVSTGSMAPTLLPGDRVLVDRLTPALAAPAPFGAFLPARPLAPGDVLLLRSPEDPRTMLIKRWVPKLEDPADAGRGGAEGYFVVGDRRHDSHDSRAFGPVARAAVVGRVVAVLASRDPAGGWRFSRTLSPVR